MYLTRVCFTSTLLDALDELVNIVLLYFDVLLVVMMVLVHIALFNGVVFGYQVLVELSKELVISLLEGLDVFVVICQRDFFTDHCECRASLNVRLSRFKNIGWPWSLECAFFGSSH